jgi:hypothetical protein
MGTTLLREVKIDRPPGLESKFSMVHGNGENIPPILVVNFDGSYPDGSAGNRHGNYIASTTLLGLSSFDPWCVILDFRKLEYRWGNSLLAVFQNIRAFMDSEKAPDEEPFPVIAVTSEKSREGFLSLVTPRGGEKPTWHFDNLGEAVDAAIIAANVWIDN